ncbi:hypothetical protein TIFTF001_003021 [Ficus carica]|uniref:Uncharacterized protein n=1 Tax=Ficus carica TaxID=3494 RepID=A0AA87ZQJ3_FICCA|nr:hypothetical protein TIFTF001_003021 [Ficus carica]
MDHKRSERNKKVDVTQETTHNKTSSTRSMGSLKQKRLALMHEIHTESDEETTSMSHLKDGTEDRNTESDKETTSMSSTLEQRWFSLLDGTNDQNTESSLTDQRSKSDKHAKRKEEVINKVLYGPERTTRRLPVFKEICPDE